MKNNPLSITPFEQPEYSQFINRSSNQALVNYFSYVFDQYARAINFGLALDDSELGVKNKTVMLSNLFVSPKLSAHPVSPEQLIEKQNSLLPKRDEYYSYLRDRPRLILLGVPGSGKTTLISAIMLALSNPSDSLAKNILGNAIPFAFILHTIKLKAVKSWDSLIQAYLNANPLVHEIYKKADLQAMLNTGQALILIDGLDEISNTEQRNGLGKAIIEGMNSYPRSRFIISSRIVGFSYENLFNLGSQSKEEKEQEQALANMHEHIPTAYLSPFDNGQIRRFTQNWYKQYVPHTEDHQQRVKDLQQSLSQNDGLGKLARIPVLLNMICFIHGRRNRLPDGRTELYQRISETYLVEMDKARKLTFQGKNHDYDYQDFCAWLGELAFIMQKRRDEVDKTVSLSYTDVSTVFKKVLAEYIDDSDEVIKQEVDYILGYIANRSGLFLPISGTAENTYYAFSHLSFQEYFAAVRLKNNLVLLSDEGWKNWRKYSKSTAWHETLVLFFEQLESTNIVEHCIKKIFCNENKLVFNNLEQFEKINIGILIAEIATNTAVKIKPKTRSDYIKHAWNIMLEDMTIYKSWFTNRGRLISVLWVHAFNSLDYFIQQIKTREITELHLSGSTFDSLEPLSTLNELTMLGLSDTELPDLSPLTHLKKLKILFLDNAIIGDASPLLNLSDSLEEITLKGANISKEVLMELKQREQLTIKT